MPKIKKHLSPQSVRISLMWIKVSIMPLNIWHYALAYMPNDNVTDDLPTTMYYHHKNSITDDL